MRAIFYIFLIFAVPMMIAWLLQKWQDSQKANRKLEDEWRLKLREFEKQVGRRLTVEEIQGWLIEEWFKERFRNAEDFARKIKFDLIDRR